MFSIRFNRITQKLDVRPSGPWSEKLNYQRLIARRREIYTLRKEINATLDRIAERQRYLLQQQKGFLWLDLLFATLTGFYSAIFRSSKLDDIPQRSQNIKKD